MSPEQASGRTVDKRADVGGGGEGARNPFFSADGQWLGFYADGPGHGWSGRVHGDRIPKTRTVKCIL